MFDRRVPDELMRVLLPGGPFSWVTELARQPISANSDPLDLGLRASPKASDAGHATLYLGTTQVLGVHVRADGRFSLSSHQHGGLFKEVQVAVRFDDGWREWQSLDRLAAAMKAIRAHVDAAIAVAPAGRQLEGRYQAALAKTTDAGFTLFDREVVLAFASETEKLGRKQELRLPLVQAQDALAAANLWAARLSPPGDKVDALGVDRDGRLLAIEVKPGTQTTGLALTPIQVAMYMRLVRAWIEADEVFAREVLEGMAQQRAALGLGSTEALRLRDPIEIVPVFAVGTPISSPRDARTRFELVRNALRESGESLTGLQLWAINMSGDISITDATELDERFW
jgi:hypothetical protein